MPHGFFDPHQCRKMPPAPSWSAGGRETPSGYCSRLMFRRRARQHTAHDRRLRMSRNQLRALYGQSNCTPPSLSFEDVPDQSFFEPYLFFSTQSSCAVYGSSGLSQKETEHVELLSHEVV